MGKRYVQTSNGIEYVGEETGFIIFRVKLGSWTIEGIL